VPKCEIFDPFFYANKFYLGWRLEFSKIFEKKHQKDSLNIKNFNFLFLPYRLLPIEALWCKKIRDMKILTLGHLMVLSSNTSICKSACPSTCQACPPTCLSHLLPVQLPVPATCCHVQLPVYMSKCLSGDQATYCLSISPLSVWQL
jgi:hypothetical protein